MDITIVVLHLPVVPFFPKKPPSTKLVAIVCEVVIVLSTDVYGKNCIDTHAMHHIS